MAKLDTIEGINIRFIRILQDVGVASVEQLLKTGRTREGRRTLSEKVGIRQSQIHKWVNQVDLSRINGVGSDYAEILVKVGVGTVTLLAEQDPEELHETLYQYKRSHRKIRRVPGLSQVERWISEAKELKPIVDF